MNIQFGRLIAEKERVPAYKKASDEVVRLYQQGGNQRVVLMVRETAMGDKDYLVLSGNDANDKSISAKKHHAHYQIIQDSERGDQFIPWKDLA